MGIALKEKLKIEVAKFTGLMMLTFTVDPELFASPQDAFEYVRKNRCISKTMQRLRRWKLVHSVRYFAVIEWHMNGWPHWHVLVDSTFLPWEELKEAWNRNWPAWKDRIAVGRPGFGSVNFRETKIERQHAAGYVTAYMTKHPEHGYPEWVTKRRVREIRRYEASRGFWSESKESVPRSTVEASSEEDGSGEAGDDEKESRVQRRIDEAVASCGRRCVVLLARSAINTETGELGTVRRFMWMLPRPVGDLAKLAQRSNKSGTVAIFEEDIPGVLDMLRGLANNDVTGTISHSSTGALHGSDKEADRPGNVQADPGCGGGVRR